MVPDSRRGSVLLLVLGVLALLSLLGTALIFMVKQENRESVLFMDKTRAEFAAESGVETAIAKIISYQNSLTDMSRWMQSYPNTPGLEIRHLWSSSFGEFDLDGDGYKEVAGSVSETYKPNGDNFRLRVDSAQSKLNINDTNSPLNIDTDPFEDQWTPERDYLAIPEHLRYPTVSSDPTQDKDPDWVYPDDPGYASENASVPGKPYPVARGRLWAIVKALTDILFPDSDIPPASPTLGDKAADAIFKARKRLLNDRFNGFHEIKDALVPHILSADQFALLKSYFTLHSWRDENVLLPTFQWRINTPPVIDPGDGINDPSAHMTYYAADFKHDYLYALLKDDVMIRPAQRPGAPKPKDRFKSMFDPVKFDFNQDGTITAPDLNNEYAYHEHFRHDRDIYQFSDMQTRYFRLDERSPVDINGANWQLIQALIKPVQGWYLKEAPAIWDGEDPRSRAEDWSEPLDGMNRLWMAMSVGYSLTGVTGYPWHIACRFHHMNFGGFATGYHCLDDTWRQDECQYYYYDSYRDYAFCVAMSGFGAFRPQHCEKSGRSGELALSKSFDVNVSAAIAKTIHDRIHVDLDGDGKEDACNPFLTWEEFEHFIIDLADGDGVNDLPGKPGAFDIYMAHALIANFNPNSRLNDFNPNKRMFLFVDKSQLSGFSAECCFHLMGDFDIEALGSVNNAEGMTEASCQMSVGAKMFEVRRFTHQRQFYEGYDGVTIGYEKFVSPSMGALPTSGAGFNAKANLDAALAYSGHSIQSYPEPEVDGANWIKESIYDGCLMLATNKAERRDLFAEGAMDEEANNAFLVNLDQTLDANFAQGASAPRVDPETSSWILDKWKYVHAEFDMMNLFYLPDPSCQVPTNQPSKRNLTRGFAKMKDASSPEDRPGCLLPDGALSDVGRTPIYESPKNIGDTPNKGRIGSVQFWIKPNFDVAQSNRVRKFFTAPPRQTDDQTVISLAWEIEKRDFLKDFSLLYFSRGGRRVTPAPSGRLDDSIYLNYDPDLSMHGGRWLPTRSLFLLAGRYVQWQGRVLSGIGSSSVNQSWREDLDIQTPGYSQYNLESHQWSHLSFSWDWVGTLRTHFPNTPAHDPPARYFNFCINGKPIEEVREQHPPFQANGYSGPPGPGMYSDYPGYFDSYDYGLQYPIQETNTGQPNYFGFGESSSALWGNHVADATYDDFVTSIVQKPESALQMEYGYGRYYNENDSVYTSPEFDLFLETQTNSDVLTLFMIGWTGYWPLSANAATAPNHPRFNDNLESANSDNYINVQGIMKSDMIYPSDPMSPVKGGHWAGDWIPFSIDVVNPSTGKWHYGEEMGVMKENMPNFAGGSQDPNWRVNPLHWDKSKGHRFCFRVHFNIAAGQTLFTSPVFDDITFVFKMKKTAIYFWEQL